DWSRCWSRWPDRRYRWLPWVDRAPRRGRTAMDETRPNRLAEARTDRGWIQQDVADHLARLAWLRYRKRVGVNANMVSKWEAGPKQPNPMYRELLCLLFKATPEYLGIGRAPAGKTTEPDDPAALSERALVDSLGGAAAILDQLGPAGGILQPRMFEAWKED